MTQHEGSTTVGAAMNPPATLIAPNAAKRPETTHHCGPSSSSRERFPTEVKGWRGAIDRLTIRPASASREQHHKPSTLVVGSSAEAEIAADLANQ
jgi:hypothetical protein